jgi:drug/metabolite transporter (DMT)-like permease
MTSAQLGELMAVSSAVLWAAAVILFRITGKKIVPLGLNLFKNTLGLMLFVLTMLLAGQSLLPSLPWREYAILLASGLLGVAISDTLFFYSLNLLGAGPASIVSCLYSPFIISLSMAFLGERLSTRQVLGVLCVVLAVVLIGYEKREKSLPAKVLLLGIALGALAQLSTAVGIVIMKPLLGHVPVLWATAVRLAAAIPALALILTLHPGRKTIIAALLDRKSWAVMVPATVLGAYLSIMVWMGGLKYTQASVAAALSQTNAAFAFILAAIFLKERVTAPKIAAVVLTLLGALLTSSL